MKLPAAGFRKFLAAAVGFTLLYTALGFLLVPVILKSIAVQALTKFLGRVVAVQKIDFNPFDMSLSAHGLRIEDSNGGTILSLDTLSATLAPMSSLLHHAWVFKEAVILEPSANVARNARGSLNFSDLLLLDWPKTLRLRFDVVRLLNGSLQFRDDAVPGGFSTTISRITATVKNFSTLPMHDNSFSITAVSESGERFSWNGSFRVHPLSSRGQASAEDVVVRKYSPYFSDRFDFTVVEGTLTARSSYEVNLARDSFTANLSNGVLLGRSLKVDEQGGTAPLFGLEGLSVSGADVDLVRQRITVDSVLLSGISASVRRLADRTLNIEHLLKPARIPSPALDRPPARWSAAVGTIRLANFAAEVTHVFGRETAEWKELLLTRPTFQTSPPGATVGEISLQDGALAFTDPSVEPPVRMAVTLLDIRIGALSTASPGPVPVSVNARIEKLAPLQISGKTDPIGKLGETSVRGLLQNVNLVPLSPYSAKYLGYELTAGDFSLEVKCLIQRRTLNLENTISIDGLTLGRKTESLEATKLPVPLALALLKDANGKITLHVPIAVALDDPTVDLQKAIIDGVIHPFTVTAAFPFTALGAQSGGGGEELGFQEFSPGSADLIPLEAAKLNTVLEGLKRWPEILLDIEGSVDSKNDTGDLRLLAASRAESVKEYLLRPGVLEPSRIFLIENPPEKIPRKGSRALLYLRDKSPGPG